MAEKKIKEAIAASEDKAAKAAKAAGADEAATAAARETATFTCLFQKSGPAAEAAGGGGAAVGDGGAAGAGAVPPAAKPAAARDHGAEPPAKRARVGSGADAASGAAASDDHSISEDEEEQQPLSDHPQVLRALALRATEVALETGAEAQLADRAVEVRLGSIRDSALEYQTLSTAIEGYTLVRDLPIDLHAGLKGQVILIKWSEVGWWAGFVRRSNVDKRDEAKGLTHLVRSLLRECAFLIAN